MQHKSHIQHFAIDARKSLVLSRRMNPLRKLYGLLKLGRADRETLARVETPPITVPPRVPTYATRTQTNIYDGNRPTFKAPKL